MIRVLIVDDSSFMISVIKNVIESVPDMKAIGFARNGLDAVAKARELNPDCITMDIKMPEMDGVETVRAIMSVNPVPIVMLSAYSVANAELTLRALEYGAIDFVAKPDGEISTNLSSVKDELLKKIRGAVLSKVKKTLPVIEERSVSVMPPVFSKDVRPAGIAVAIGVSTGGPRLLKDLIPMFAEDIKAGILISQHMPAGYTATLAGQLNRITPLDVVEAKDLMTINEGCVYVCPGDYNMVVEQRQLLLKRPTAADLCVPSIDEMFTSAGKSFKQNCVGVVLTGLGSDGTIGVMSIKRNGGYVICQDEATSAVFGMPKSAMDSGNVDAVLPAKSIPAKINKWVRNRIKNG